MLPCSRTWGLSPRTHRLRSCIECSRRPDPGERWSLRFADLGEVAVYCPQVGRTRVRRGAHTAARIVTSYVSCVMALDAQAVAVGLDIVSEFVTLTLTFPLSSSKSAPNIWS
jgi:hypothetical protein